MVTAGRRAAPPGPVAGALGALARAVWPVACPGCGLPDVAVCDGCRRSLLGPAPVVAPSAAGTPPVRAGAAYEGPARRLLLAWKEQGRHDLAPLLADALRRAGSGALPPDVVTTRGVARPCGRRPRGRPLGLVPMPSRGSAVRARGDDLVADLARRWARVLRAGGRPVVVAPVLALRAGAGDQVGRGAAARAAARSGALRLRGAAPATCVLVDDVVTTGSTLSEAAAVLGRGGATVLGAVVVLATPPPRGAGPRYRGSVANPP
ncbi:phosphoribosyltransferase family protein [Pseudokineococcus basanitobsidens]|uniref:Phosphoribosyltransferase family protein n=1 Tax=Pseudokineococcus basanitobsidens TaxID=1926649 RepID=A0ABU8RM70_9ACTN